MVMVVTEQQILALVVVLEEEMAVMVEMVGLVLYI